jgi:sterol desaturase/sphingolipid hydroxylase (fatty acid hydroxylase superfamily)
VPWLQWTDHPLYLAALVLVAPAIHEVHFFVIHRAIHTKWLYKWIHSIHHNSVNPSPFSSLSMHPVEAFLYHAVALWHLVIPSNPIVALFQLHMAGFGAINGHLGFEKLELTDTLSMDSHAYTHYLHHKHFEVNYGGDGLIPLDVWLGTWHDGSKEGDRRMQERYQKKLERMNARNSER